MEELEQYNSDTADYRCDCVMRNYTNDISDDLTLSSCTPCLLNNASSSSTDTLSESGIKKEVLDDYSIASNDKAHPQAFSLFPPNQNDETSAMHEHWTGNSKEISPTYITITEMVTDCTDTNQGVNYNLFTESYINNRKRELASEINHLKKITDTISGKVTGGDGKGQELMQEIEMSFQHINNTLYEYANHISNITKNDRNVSGSNRPVSFVFVNNGHNHNDPIKARPEYQTILHAKQASIVEEQINVIVEQLKSIYVSDEHIVNAATFTKASGIQKQQRDTLIEDQASLLYAIQAIRESLLTALFRMRNNENGGNLDLDEEKRKMLEFALDSNFDINLDICLDQTMTWINQIESIANHLHMNDNTCTSNVTCECNQQNSNNSNGNYSCSSNSSRTTPASHTNDYTRLFPRLPYNTWNSFCKQYSEIIASLTDIRQLPGIGSFIHGIRKAYRTAIHVVQTPLVYIYFCFDIWMQLIRRAVRLSQQLANPSDSLYSIRGCTLVERLYKWASYYW
ncbi:hypothetical protein BDF22DRAFT_740245 [Syncephalis plumigaleata]|nr:hypothetical protein BDF22DRAFT_740245 [Syncephalis plumigaleata]